MTRFDIQDDGQVGRRSPVAQRATCSTSSGTSTRPGALVGQHRVDVAVADHHCAARPEPARPPRKRWWALSAAYSSASARGEISPVAGSSTIRRIAAPKGVARLERADDLVALLAQPGAQQVDLGGLAHAVATLEDDERPRSGSSPVQLLGDLAHSRTNSRRDRRALSVSRSKSRPARKASSGVRSATNSNAVASRPIIVHLVEQTRRVEPAPDPGSVLGHHLGGDVEHPAAAGPISRQASSHSSSGSRR